jgi:hypothetical protein
MELNFSPDHGLDALPASSLWGRDVYDSAGRRMGTIDSIVRNLGGPVKAIVRTARRPRRFIFVDLEGAVFDGESVVVASIATGDIASDAPPEARRGIPRLLAGWRRV